MNRQNVALALGIVALAWSLRAYLRSAPVDPPEDPPLPEWSGSYLSAFDRFVRGDADASFTMREIAKQHIPQAR